MISVPTVIFRPDCVTRRSSGPETPFARDSTSSMTRTLLRRSVGPLEVLGLRARRSRLSAETPQQLRSLERLGANDQREVRAEHDRENQKECQRNDSHVPSCLT